MYIYDYILEGEIVLNQKDTYKLNFSEKITLAEFEEHFENINLENTPIITTNGISGVVKDQSGVLISGATVKLFDTSFNPITHTTTNENGAYLFQGISNAHYHVYAVKDGYTLSNKGDLNYTGSDIVLNDLIINEDTTFTKGNIYGYVLDESGVGINNSIVKLFDTHNNLISETISAEDGEYILPKINAGNYTLTASAINYAPEQPINIEVIDSNNLRQNLNLIKLIENKKGTINGYVYNSNGNPIPNAIVSLYEEVIVGSLILRSICYTNSEGKYFFGSVSQGTYVVKAKVTESR